MADELVVNSTASGCEMTNASSACQPASSSSSSSGGGLAGVLVEGVALVVVDVAVVVGNILVIASVCVNRRLRTVTNCYVVSLAAADLLVGLVVLPLAIKVELTGGRWQLGQVLCDVWVSADVLLCTASILNLCCISLDRYFAITNPLVYVTRRSKRLALAMIVAVWTLAALVSCPPMLGWREAGRDVTPGCVLTQEPGYIIYSSLGSFYIPLLVMVFVYARIFKIVMERRGRLERNGLRLSVKRTRRRDPGPRQNTGKPLHQALSRTVSAQSEPRAGDYAPVNTSECCERTQSSEQRGGHSSEVGGRSRTCLKYTTSSGSGWGGEQGRESAVLLRESKTAKTLAVVVGCFVLCWLPFFLVYLIEPFCRSACTVTESVRTVITWLGYCNSVINPFIYAFYNTDFRHTFWRLTCALCLSENSTRFTRQPSRPTQTTRL